MIKSWDLGLLIKVTLFDDQGGFSKITTLTFSRLRPKHFKGLGAFLKIFPSPLFSLFAYLL